MDKKKEEIQFLDVLKIIIKRRVLIVSTTIVFAILAALFSLSLPSIYEGEAIVSLPRVGNLSNRTDMTKNEKVLVSVAETRTFLEIMTKKVAEHNSFAGITSDLTKTINKIILEPIAGDDFNVKITIQFYQDMSGQGNEIFVKIIEYLQSIQYVQDKINIEKINLEEVLAEIKKSIESTLSTRRLLLEKLTKLQNTPIDFLEIDKQINNLRLQQIEREHQLASLGTYKITTRPNIYKDKVKHKVFLSAVVVGLFGFFISLFLSFILEMKEQILME